jgi:hypothetical protein
MGDFNTWGKKLQTPSSKCPRNSKIQNSKAAESQIAEKNSGTTARDLARLGSHASLRLGGPLLFCTFGIGKFGRGFAQRKQFTLNTIASESSHNSGTEFADLK